MTEESKETPKSKTFKREVAIVFAIFWLLITFRIFFVLEPESITAYSEFYKSMTTMIFLFLGAAFGMDFYKKL